MVGMYISVQMVDIHASFAEFSFPTVVRCNFNSFFTLFCSYLENRGPVMPVGGEFSRI
jgi:hypothetical protein